MFKLCVAFFSLALVLRSVGKTQASQGIDVSQAISTAALTCLKLKGYEFAIVRAFRSSGVPDYNAPETIRNAHEAGFDLVEAYMFPCPTCGNAQKQVDDMLALNLNVDWIWLDVEVSNWFENKTKNQEFLQELINAALGKIGIGIYTSENNWSTLMGLDYTGGAQFPLWYAHYDKQPNFKDFTAFGGWIAPTMKQFDGVETVCGVDVDPNYRTESMSF